MKKILVLAILLLSGCSNYKTGEVPNKIIIEDISINEEYLISGINEKVNGIVLFSEYGRPNIDNSNTIIGAHSGYGNNALFNNINKLEENDVIVLYNDSKKYVFFVEEVYIVEENNISILYDKGYTSLTLITCNIFNNKERIVVVARLSA